MTMPYYASPEQLMRDRSEYARKGISRGRSVAVLTYADGVLFIAENPSSTLHKVGELYDRIGFAAVGRYSEFESLRVAGVRLAEVRDTPEHDQLYRLTFDGSIVDEPDFVVMGGQADAVTGNLRERFHSGMGLSDALEVGVRALSAVSPVTAGASNGGPTRLTGAQLEVAVLDRRRPKRAFRRVVGAALSRVLGDEATADTEAAAETEAAAGVPAHAPSVS